MQLCFQVSTKFLYIEREWEREMREINRYDRHIDRYIQITKLFLLPLDVDFPVLGNEKYTLKFHELIFRSLTFGFEIKLGDAWTYILWRGRG